MAKRGRPATDEYAQARMQQQMYGIAEYVFKAWNAQRYSAIRRGIPFRFTLFQWDQWWRSVLRELGPDARRGRRKGNYMMARIGDRGAYEHDNVYAASATGNAGDIPDDVRVLMVERATATQAANGKPRGSHLKVRGDGHPRSHAVVTPFGRFGSIRLASEAHAINERTGRYRISRGLWSLDA